MHTHRTRNLRIAAAALLVLAARLPVAHAEDVLDREVRFHIAPASLATALIELSAASNVQIAVADADVAQLQSGAVEGSYSVRAALGILLRGTGLEFSRVGAATVAIRKAPAGPAIGAVARTGAPAAAAGITSALALPTDSGAALAAPAELPDVTVTTPRPPTEQELAGDSLAQFIVHHATVHYVNTGVVGNLAHWRGGRPQTICPLTVGLEPGYNAFVTARVRAVADSVGAPTQPDLSCKDNVRIIFTPEPEKVMADVSKWASVYFGPRYPSMRRLMMFNPGHAVQGWYITTGGAGRVLNADANLLLGLEVLPLWPVVIPSGLNTGGRQMTGIVSVILVVDTTKAGEYAIGTMADYLAVLALSVVQSPDHCDPLPSILDLGAPDCGTRDRPTGVTAGDLAFLRALYYRNTGLGSSLSRSEIQTHMLRQFGPR